MLHSQQVGDIPNLETTLRGHQCLVGLFKSLDPFHSPRIWVRRAHFSMLIIYAHNYMSRRKRWVLHCILDNLLKNVFGTITYLTEADVTYS